MPEFFNILLLAKAAASIGIVVTLSVLAERAGPRVAGLLIGLPLGAGMVIVFTGLEQGSGFAGESARHMVPGFVTTMVFVFAYAAVAAARGRGGFSAVLAPSLAAHAAYAVAAAAIGWAEFSFAVGIAMVVVGAVTTARIMAYLPDTAIVQRVRFGWGVLAFRAVTATAVVLLITGIAGTIGPKWTGILTAYPITLFPLILVLHITYTGAEVAAVLKHVPMGLGSVTSFCITIALVMPSLGSLLGTFAGYVVAVVYLLAYSWLSEKRRRK